MKKIMFNDVLNLTQAVLNGTKTMTRWILKDGTPLGNLEERGRLLGLAYSINKRFFPRCVKARLRHVARFDAEICGADFDSAYNELLFEFNLKK